jgi:hypothetical protein
VTLVEELEALAGKYATLERLRRRRELLAAAGHLGFDDAERAARRLEFRRVAHEFPGALRELETTPADVLAAKAAAVRDEADRARRDPAAAAPARAWVAVVLDFHASLREALAIKLWLARRAVAVPLDEATVAACAAWYGAAGRPARRGAWPVDAATLERLHRPPRGRVLPVVWAAVVARHGGTAAALEQAVFGPPPHEPAATGI